MMACPFLISFLPLDSFFSHKSWPKRITLFYSHTTLFWDWRLGLKGFQIKLQGTDTEMPGCIFKPQCPAVFAFTVSWSLLLLHNTFFCRPWLTCQFRGLKLHRGCSPDLDPWQPLKAKQTPHFIELCHCLCWLSSLLVPEKSKTCIIFLSCFWKEKSSIQWKLRL